MTSQSSMETVDPDFCLANELLEDLQNPALTAVKFGLGLYDHKLDLSLIKDIVNAFRESTWLEKIVFNVNIFSCYPASY